MRAMRITPNLRVADVDTARSFYTDYLGLSTEAFNMGWVARFTSPETGAHVQLLTRDATASEDAVISVHTDDIDAAYAEAQDRGLEIVHPLTTESWGVRRFLVRAPDGNVVNIVRHRESTGSVRYLFSGVPVTDRAAASTWFAAFFGRPADEIVGGEALWQVSDTAWVVVDEQAERAGRALLTLGVDGLDDFLARFASHGIEHGPVETYDNGVRHVVVLDPDGNSLSLAEELPTAGTSAGRP
jgi:catechol 2,3-dioxygenase-like lactoylglutathione lyase family enzyme